jgi:uncharacterized protein
MPKLRKPLRATLPECIHLAADIAPRDFAKRAALVHLPLMAVAIVGKDAVRVHPKVRETLRRSQAQISQTAKATFMAKQAAARVGNRPAVLGLAGV